MEINKNKLISLFITNFIIISILSQNKSIIPAYQFQSKIDSANNYLKVNDFSNAIILYKKAIAIDSFSIYARNKLSNTYLERAEKRENTDNIGKLHDYDSAIMYCNFPDSYLYILRADIKVKRKNFSGAMQDYNKAIELEPKAELRYVKRGELKDKLNDYEGAIEDYSMEIKLNPNYWIPYSNRGFSKRMIGKYEEAAEDYTVAINLYPDKPYLPYYLCRAESKFNSCEYQKAIDDYLFVINSDPDGKYYLEVYLKIARTQLMLKDYQSALKSINNHINLFPDNGNGYYERALLNIELKNLATVCDDLKKAKDLKYEFDEIFMSNYCKI